MSPPVPRFSIVIPTRSRDQSLARCLEQLLPAVQKTNAEIVVSDDGAGEATRTMIASCFPSVKWTAGPRRGPAANRNHGASLAQGEFIVFIDDDVVPAPGLLAEYERAIVSDVHVYEGRTTCRAGLHSPLETAPVNEKGGWLWSCNMMVRRSFWQAFGGFDEDFRFPHMEDVAFRERLNYAGERFAFVSAATVDHPPRRLPPASARIAQHESTFIYHYKYLGRAPSVPRFVRDHLRHHLQTIVRREKGWESLLAVGSMCLEVYGVLRLWRGWDQKHRELAKDPLLIGRKPPPG